MIFEDPLHLNHSILTILDTVLEKELVTIGPLRICLLLHSNLLKNKFQSSANNCFKLKPGINKFTVTQLLWFKDLKFKQRLPASSLYNHRVQHEAH